MSNLTKLGQAHAMLADALTEIETRDYCIKAPWRSTIALVRDLGKADWFNTYIGLRHHHEVEYERCMGWNAAYMETATTADLHRDIQTAIDDVSAFIRERK